MSYVKFMLSQLNVEDGSFAFEHLARDLIYAEYCRNIRPASGPSSAGDRGEDAATHSNYILDSDNQLTLYQGQAPRTDLNITFAFSIRQDWKSKLEADVNKILKELARPDKIVFATNQFIQTTQRQDAERDLAGKHGIEFEILDGSWFLLQLEGDHYVLAVKHLGCEPKPDQQLDAMYRRVLGAQYGPMSPEDAATVQDLEAAVRYRTAYSRVEHLVIDLQALAETNAEYYERLEESYKWYEEALAEARERNAETRVVLDLCYSYFKALFKVPSNHRKILSLLPEYRRLVFTADFRSYFSRVNTWQYFLMPTLRDDAQFLSFLRETHAYFTSYDVAALPPLGQALVFEAEVDSELPLLILGGEVSLDAYIAKLSQLVDMLEGVELFHTSTLAEKLAVLSPALSRSPGYEPLYLRVETLASKVWTDAERGLLRRSRGVAHFDAGDFLGAIVHLEHCRFLLRDHEDLRGKVLASMMIALCHHKRRDFYASEWALLYAVQIATAIQDNLQLDLVSAAFAQLHTSALEDGRLLTAITYARYYLSSLPMWTRDTSKGEVFVETLLHNATIVLSRLFTSNRRLHNVAVRMLLEFIPSGLFRYSDLATKDLDVLATEYGDADARSDIEGLHKLLRSGALSPLDMSILDETSDQLLSSFKNEFLSVEVLYDNSLQTRIAAYSLCAILQHMFALCVEALRSLDWLEDNLRIHLAVAELPSDELFRVRQLPSNELVEVRITLSNNAIPAITKLPFDGYMRFALGTWIRIVDLCVLNPQDEITSLMAEMEAAGIVERFSHITPVGALVSDIFGDDLPTPGTEGTHA